MSREKDSTCLVDVEDCYKQSEEEHMMIIKQADMPFFKLPSLIAKNVPTQTDIDKRRQLVIMGVQFPSPRHILNFKTRALKEHFEDLVAEDVAVVFEAIDKEFFSGSIGGFVVVHIFFNRLVSNSELKKIAILTFHKRTVEFLVVDDQHSPDRAACYSREGNHNFFCVCGPKFLRAFSHVRVRVVQNPLCYFFFLISK